MIFRRYNFFASMLLLLVMSTGCRKFLKEDSQDLSYVANAKQLEEVLVGEGYELTTVPNNYSSYVDIDGFYFPWLNMMDDDITENVTGYDYTDFRINYFGFYTWQADPFVTNEYAPMQDIMWKKMYKHINATNIVIAKASEMNDDPATLRRIKGEAEFLRAGYYFQMVNLYSKPYNKKTAVTDLGVPLKTTEYVEDRYFTRSTVDSVYRQIVADLSDAETNLEGAGFKTLYHADINAVNLLQSRVYLFMQDYEKALEAANKVIARKGQLASLEGRSSGSSYFKMSSTENIFTQGGNSMMYMMDPYSAMSYKPSDELLDMYQDGDLRKNIFFTTGFNGAPRYSKVYCDPYGTKITESFSDNFFLRNVEAYLNKAEAAAMLGKDAEANGALNTLRKMRFDAAHYQDLNLSGEPLVNFVMDERRREMCFEGIRFFDLKRYSVREKYPMTKEIVHTYSAADYSTPPYVKARLVLKADDPAYLIPIPSSAISFNQGVLKQNDPRPDRKF